MLGSIPSACTVKLSIESIKPVIELTRFREYLASVMITTLLGVLTAQAGLDYKVAVVLIANWLMVGFAFMINDVEDWQDDVLTPCKAERNPVSAQRISVETAYAVSFIVGVLSLIFYAWLGLWPFIVGLSCFIISFLYSWKPVRLKAMPVIDVVSHGLMLAGLQLLAGYFTFSYEVSFKLLIPFLAVVSISFYGQLFNETRDREGDKKAGLKHTGNCMSLRKAQVLMFFFLFTGLATVAATFLYMKIIPVKTMYLIVVLSIIFMIKPLYQFSRDRSIDLLLKSFQRPFEDAAAIGLGVGMLINF